MAHIRWGILGAAKFAAQHMGPALHAAEGGSLAALATRDPGKADPFRAIAPDLAVHSDYDALLNDPAIDAVYIPLPNSMHVDWTLKALQAGKHVLTEKPVAMKADEIDSLIAARDAAGKLAAEAYMIVFHPQWQHTRDLVFSGQIGQLRHVEGMFCFNNADEPGNIRNQADLGGGAMRDIGVYVIGSTRFVAGCEPQQVSARIRWESGFDVFTDISARFPGFTYSACVSTRLNPYQTMTFHGDAGSVQLTAPFNGPVFGDAAVILRRAGQPDSVARFNGARQYDLQVAAFNRSALTGAAYPCPLEFSRGTQAMMDAAFADAVALD
ncbi:oxidoreductase [Meridianimarinicoccus roseus]|uniref:Oxidoreductase n=1 Tax=Meridianimarinicoccus roseus TaxID=2072018 RepID=A0A2V2LDW5_9RHOB|nr:Gfo/Idh/MocA family oxidoreductase [Meridianimarinicoccus roseus]PWR03740.1 oxidoreductase [Meridianimarinicoccus roseus]